ncbi:MAG: heme-binding protein [Halofilum sp. (in: g-proteobacteria)]|nr:heme-binding protein [Halofilum sp. (in: g-proteobacteria)]
MAFYEHRAPLPLESARAMIRAALAAARERDLKPMTVVVLDAGAHLVAMEREDGSGVFRFEVAQGKAWAALGVGTPSGAFGAANADRPAFLGAVAAASGGHAVPVAGGALVLDGDGLIVGAVGVSGDTSDADEAVAAVGIEAGGFAAGTS